MSPFINEAGYAVLDLRTKERRRVYKVHRLLMIAFSPIPFASSSVISLHNIGSDHWPGGVETIRDFKYLFLK
jgi:hypothetical protein